MSLSQSVSGIETSTSGPTRPSTQMAADPRDVLHNYSSDSVFACRDAGRNDSMGTRGGTVVFLLCGEANYSGHRASDVHDHQCRSRYHLRRYLTNQTFHFALYETHVNSVSVICGLTCQVTMTAVVISASFVKATRGQILLLQEIEEPKLRGDGW